MQELSTAQLTTTNNNVLAFLTKWRNEFLSDPEGHKSNQILANNFFNLACTDTEIGRDMLDELHDLDVVNMDYVYDILSNCIDFNEMTKSDAKWYQQVEKLEKKVTKQQKRGLRKNHTEWLTTSDYNGNYFPVDKETLTVVLNDMVCDCKNMVKCN